MLDESIRGQVEGDLFKQVTLTFNPWNERHWIKARFFDKEDPDTLAITTNYMCNEWLDKADFAVFERMKQHNPRRYNVAGLGNWGVIDGVVYERWKEETFSLKDLPQDAQPAFGLDFGYTNDPTALFCGYISIEQKRLFVWDELYKKGLSNKAIYDEISKLGYTKERITADCAEPKSIDELKGLGIRRIEGAKKGKDSVNNGIQWIQDLEIIVHPRCVNFLLEIGLYSWKKDKFGKALNEPEDDNNHLMDAMRYALEKFIQKNKWLY
jgi:phage terminase large subunit